MFAQDASGCNVYNRSVRTKPCIKIGNWVEELALWEEQEKRKLTGEEQTAKNTIFDITVDNKAIYGTSNSAYGTSKPRYVEHPVVRQPKVSVIKEKRVNPYLTKRAFDQHLQAIPTGHDLLNRNPDALPELTTTSGDAFQPILEQGPNDIPFEKKYDQVVTIYNPTGDGRKNFARSGAFTKPNLE